MKKLTFVVMMVFSSLVMANPAVHLEDLKQAGWYSLTEEQRAVMLTEVIKSKAEIEQAKVPIDAVKALDGISKEDMSQWSTAATEAGKAVVAFGRELGIAGKEFANTGFGMFVMIIALFWFAGKTIISTFIGFMLLGPFPYLAYRAMVRLCADREDYVVKTKISSDGTKTEIMGRRYKKLSDQEQFITFICMVIMFIIGLVALT